MEKDYGHFRTIRMLNNSFVYFLNRNGTKQSMLERVYSQLKIQDLDTNTFMITNVQQKDCVIHPVGTDTNIISEPTRRDTASYFKHMNNDTQLLISPYK